MFLYKLVPHILRIPCTGLKFITHCIRVYSDANSSKNSRPTYCRAKENKNTGNNIDYFFHFLFSY